jgi:pyrimidine-specific ribonucleoside hydrolase
VIPQRPAADSTPAPEPAAPEPAVEAIPLIVDTDPGVDDAVALLVAMGSPEARLAAVTTVHGNVDLATTTDNAQRLLALGGRADVPLAMGADRPLVHPQQFRAADWHGPDGLGGLAHTLPDPAATPDPRGAVELMAETLRESATPVTIAAIGPLTNIALFLAVHPELAPKIGRLVVMGGALSGGNTTAAAEFNVWSDPEAARRVLVEEPLPTTLVPLDLTHRAWVDAAWLDALAASGPRGATMAHVLDHYRAQWRASHGQDGVVLHDAIAVLEAVIPGILRTTPLPLEVVCDQGPARGCVIADRRGAAEGRLVDVATDADLDAVRAEILRRIS